MKSIKIKRSFCAGKSKLIATLAAGLTCLVNTELANAAPPGQNRVAADRILVKPYAGVSDTEFSKILKPHGASNKEKIKGIGVHIVSIPPNANISALIKALQLNPHIKFAEADRLVGHDMLPNDPYLGSMWHHTKINSNSAWDLSSGDKIKIAILDTGVNPSHPDLIGGLLPGWNVINNNSSDTQDIYGHGTAVAGSAAAQGNNAAGIAGVSWKSQIIPVRVTNDPTGYAYWSDIAKAITWAADNGAKVANASYNVSGSASVISAAQYLRNRGGVLVVSAGNDSTDPLFSPNDAITSVSATDSSDNRASWSNYGNWVDVSAPGVGIYTTNNSGGYNSWSGTSFSSPIVAGVYALMMAANPNLSPSQLDQILYKSAVDLGTPGFDSYYGYGRVNIYQAVSSAKSAIAADTQAPTVSISSPAANSQVKDLATVSVSATDNVEVSKVELWINNQLLATEITAPYTFNWDTNTFTDGAATLISKVYDGAGNTGTSSVNVKIANDTIPPAVSITSPTSGSVVSGTVNISASATDNKKVSKLSLFINGKNVAITYGASINYTWSIPASRGKTKTGSAIISVNAEDAAGNVASASVSVTTK